MHTNKQGRLLVKRGILNMLALLHSLPKPLKMKVSEFKRAQTPKDKLENRRRNERGDKILEHGKWLAQH